MLCTNMDFYVKVSHRQSQVLVEMPTPNNSLLHYCSLVYARHSEMGNHNENGLRSVKTTQFQKRGCFEAFNNWTTLMALACRSILAAGSFIIVAQQKSPYRGFISPSVLLPFFHSCQKLLQGYEIKCLRLKRR